MQSSRLNAPRKRSVTASMRMRNENTRFGSAGSICVNRTMIWFAASTPLQAR